MKTYEEYCPIAKGAEVIGDRWNLLILREILLTGSRRFNDLERFLPGISRSVLSQRLKQLQHVGRSTATTAASASPPNID